MLSRRRSSWAFDAQDVRSAAEPYRDGSEVRKDMMPMQTMTRVLALPTTVLATAAQQPSGEPGE
jgi:hypothetical protein